MLVDGIQHGYKTKEKFMWKKVLVLFLVLIMIVSVFVACDNAVDEDIQNPDITGDSEGVDDSTPSQAPEDEGDEDEEDDYVPAPGPQR